jgi:hypothetical protein
MSGLLRLLFGLVVDLFRSRAALEVEIIVLRQQITVLRRGKPNRLTFMATDRLVLGWICRLFPSAREALAIVRPETVVRWHRAGFRSYWRWKSRGWPGRPSLSAQIQKLIREMSIANPLWGAPQARRPSGKPDLRPALRLGLLALMRKRPCPVLVLTYRGRSPTGLVASATSRGRPCSSREGLGALPHPVRA